jgi:hypothetical protein
MSTTKSPGAVAALGASEIDGLRHHVVSKLNRQELFTQAPIPATLIGSDSCEAAGIRVRAHAPVLALCRELVAAGFNPAFSLEAWRGETLCLRVRSIGEAARFTVVDGRHGTPRLRRRQEAPPGYVRGSSLAQIADQQEVPTPDQPGISEALL